MEIKLLFCFVNTITRPILVTSRVFKIQPIWNALSGNKQHKISLLPSSFFFCEQKLSARSRFDTCALPLTSPASNLIKNSGEKTLLFVCRLIFKTKKQTHSHWYESSTQRKWGKGCWGVPRKEKRNQTFFFLKSTCFFMEEACWFELMIKLQYWCWLTAWSATVKSQVCLNQHLKK